MGTHPIFESDFDCLTEKMALPLLAAGAAYFGAPAATLGALGFTGAGGAFAALQSAGAAGLAVGTKAALVAAAAAAAATAVDSETRQNAEKETIKQCKILSEKCRNNDKDSCDLWDKYCY